MSVELSKTAGARGAAPATARIGLADSEAPLVDAARRGDVSAFESLLARFEQRIFRLALNITGNREDAEEATQDAFLRAFLRLDTFHGDARFSTWLTRIAINQALMKLRKRRPNVSSLEDLVATGEESLPRQIVDWGPNPEQRYSQTELRGILDAAVAELTESQRVVVQLRDVEELSTEETARALGISIASVKSRLLRARLALREKLNRHFKLPSVGPQLCTNAAD